MSPEKTLCAAVPHELPDDSGVAHVIEHLVGHGRREDGGSYLLPELADRGVVAAFCGFAYRGFSCYVATGRRAGVDAFTRELSDAMLWPRLDREAIAAERGTTEAGRWRVGTVEDELLLRGHWLRDAVGNVTRSLYYGESLRHDAGGVIDALRALTDEGIAAFHREWYRAQSLVWLEIDHQSGSTRTTGAVGAWQWVPCSRHVAVALDGQASAQLGRGALALGWRVGPFDRAQRRANVLLARCLAGILRAPATRRALERAGWKLKVAPLVDATMPDPCVVACLAPAAAADASADGAAGARSALLQVLEDEATVTAALRSAGGIHEPLFEDPWGSLAVLTVAEALAGGDRSSAEPDAVEAADALRLCVTEAARDDARPVGAAGRFRVDGTSGPSGASTAPVGWLGPPTSDEAARASHDGTAQTVSDTRERTGGEAAAVTVVAREDGSRWPTGLVGVNIRYYPPPGSPWWRALGALPALCQASESGRGRPLPSVGAGWCLGRVRPYAEWTVQAPSREALARQLDALAACSLEAEPEAVAAPSLGLPEGSLVAAALAGAPAAVMALAVRGHAVPGIPAVPDAPDAATAQGGLLSGAITGTGLEGDESLRGTVRDVCLTLRETLTAASPSSAATPTRVELDQDEEGYWVWRGRTDRASGRPAEAIVGVAARSVVGCPDGFSAISAAIRRRLRRSGFYAVSGRVEPDWAAAVFSVASPALDASVVGVLREAVAAELPARPPAEDTGALGWAVRDKVIDPLSSLAALQRETVLSVPPGPPLRLPDGSPRFSTVFVPA